MKVTTMYGITIVDEAGTLMIIIHHQYSECTTKAIAVNKKCTVAQYIKK